MNETYTQALRDFKTHMATEQWEQALSCIEVAIENRPVNDPMEDAILSALKFMRTSVKAQLPKGLRDKFLGFLGVR